MNIAAGDPSKKQEDSGYVGSWTRLSMPSWSDHQWRPSRPYFLAGDRWEQLLQLLSKVHADANNSAPPPPPGLTSSSALLSSQPSTSENLFMLFSGISSRLYSLGSIAGPGGGVISARGGGVISARGGGGSGRGLKGGQGVWRDGTAYPHAFRPSTA